MEQKMDLTTKKYIGALLGLAGAAASGHASYTEDTLHLLVKSLVILNGSIGDCNIIKEHLEVEQSIDLYQRLIVEKKKLVPGCSTCKTPCGNTSDYNIDSWNEDSNTGKVKWRLLNDCIAYAISLNQNLDSAMKKQEETLLRALCYLRYNLDESQIESMRTELNNY